MDKIKVFINSVGWGFMLWLVGYILGIVFFMFMPADMIGWAILPIGVAITLWVLLKKIKRDHFLCYIGLGFIWTIMAVVLDYVFIVKLFHSANYYKLDVYVYYAVTFFLPIIVGWYKMPPKLKA